MRFLLDEDVPVDVAEYLKAQGHEVFFARNYLMPGSPDPVVAAAGDLIEAVLVTCDADYDKIAPRIPKGHRERFRKLSRIRFRCRQAQARARLEVEHEAVQFHFARAQKKADKRMIIEIGATFFKVL